MNGSVSDRRAVLLKEIFPSGIPKLWCPTLTHFSGPAEPDLKRIEVHLRHISRHVGGILIPGSTGEGWEMRDSDIRRLLDKVLDMAMASSLRVLIGVLKTSTDAMLAGLKELGQYSDHPAVVGFTLCPPKGAHLTQPAIASELRCLLDCGLPTALYQLPQMTDNEMSAETVAGLAEQYANFLMFKDTSGNDSVANSGLVSDIFMVRGSERGGYDGWLRATGGGYDGFLLSTANVFAKELATVINLVHEGRRAEAQSLSERIAGVVAAAFNIVHDFAVGNAFTNANKAMDHIMAHGANAGAFSPPLLYSGVRLPEESIRQAIVLFKQNGMTPANGYLDT